MKQYLGNVIGPQGPKGDKGDPGGLIASSDEIIYNSTTGECELSSQIKNKLSAIDYAYDNGFASKNLFDISEFARLYPSCCTYSDDELLVTADSVLYSVGLNANIPIGTTISFDVKAISATNVRVYFYHEDGTKEYAASNNTTYTHKVVGNPSKAITSIKFDWSDSGTFAIKNFMVNEGSTEEEYTPYTKSNLQITQALSSLQPMVGSSAKFKQYAQNTPFSSRDGITTSTDGNYSVLNGTATSSSYAGGWWGLNSTTVPKTKIGNKIIIGTKIISGGYSGTITFGTGKDLASIGQSLIKTLEESDYVSTNLSRFGYSANATFTNLKIVAQFFDLTEIFGKGNEPTTVEQFESMFSDTYYPYNATELPLSNLKITEELSKKGRYRLLLNGTATTGGSNCNLSASMNNYEYLNFIMYLSNSGAGAVVSNMLVPRGMFSGGREVRVNYISMNTSSGDIGTEYIRITAQYVNETTVKLIANIENVSINYSLIIEGINY